MSAKSGEFKPCALPGCKKSRYVTRGKIRINVSGRFYCCEAHKNKHRRALQAEARKGWAKCCRFCWLPLDPAREHNTDHCGPECSQRAAWASVGTKPSRKFGQCGDITVPCDLPGCSATMLRYPRDAGMLNYCSKDHYLEHRTMRLLEYRKEWPTRCGHCKKPLNPERVKRTEYCDCKCAALHRAGVEVMFRPDPDFTEENIFAWTEGEFD